MSIGKLASFFHSRSDSQPSRPFACLYSSQFKAQRAVSWSSWRCLSGWDPKGWITRGTKIRSRPKFLTEYAWNSHQRIRRYTNASIRRRKFKSTNRSESFDCTFRRDNYRCARKISVHAWVIQLWFDCHFPESNSNYGQVCDNNWWTSASVSWRSQRQLGISSLGAAQSLQRKQQ